MEVTVHTRNVEIGGDLRAGVGRRVEHAVRVFGTVEKVDVEMAEEANPRIGDGRCRVELTAGVGGRVVRIEAAAPTFESALDDGLERLTRQLRRLKERLIDSHRRANRAPRPVEEQAEEQAEEPEIVRVKQFVMKPMSVDEAILQMDMLGHSFFVFHNAATERSSVIYRRRDGRLGLIESA